MRLMLVSSKAVDLGLGGLGPKTSETMSGAASGQPAGSAEVAPEAESEKQKGIEAAAPPMGADSLPGDL